MTWQSWSWLPTLLWMATYIPASPRPSKKPPKSQTPHFQELCQAVCSFTPRAQPAISVHSARRLNGIRYYISECLFSVEVCVLVCKHSCFRQAANVLPGITKSGHPKYTGFAAACLLDLFISFFSATDAFSEILGGSAYAWAVKPYQNTEVEMEVQKSLHETSASCTCLF